MLHTQIKSVLLQWKRSQTMLTTPEEEPPGLCEIDPIQITPWKHLVNDVIRRLAAIAPINFLLSKGLFSI